MTPSLIEIADSILAAAGNRARCIVALAGPPAAGKSTLSQKLADELNDRHAGIAAVVPMDGYHYDNAVLEPQGLLDLKGAPETFNPMGLRCDLERIRTGTGNVAVPVFDRPLDLARAGGRIITPDHRIVIVEGNYLLLDKAPWSALRNLFDLTIFLDVDNARLEDRLIRRWLDMGQDETGALAKTRHKDMRNAQLVKQASIEPDIRWVNDAPTN